MTGGSTLGSAQSIAGAYSFLVPVTALWLSPYLLPVLLPTVFLGCFAYAFFLAGGIGLLVLCARIAQGLAADRAWARRWAVIVAYMCLFPALAGFMLIAFNIGLPVASLCLLSALWFGYVTWCLSRSAVGLGATGGVLLAYGLLEGIIMRGVQNRRAAVGLAVAVAGGAFLYAVWRMARLATATALTSSRPGAVKRIRPRVGSPP